MKRHNSLMARFNTFVRGLRESATRDRITQNDALDAMQEAYEQMQADAARPVDVDAALDLFLMDWLGKPGPDHDGAYGPQSPDLVAEWMRQFKPGWTWTLGNAGDLVNKPWGLSPTFQSVPVMGVPRRGDVVVFAPSDDQPFGNVGIVTSTEPFKYFTVVQGLGCRIVQTFYGDAPAAFFRKV